MCYDVGENGAGVIGSWRNLTRRIDPAPTSGGNVLVTLFSYDVHDNLTRTLPPKGVTSTSSTGCATDLSSSLDLDYATTLTYDTEGVKLLATTRTSTDPDTSATVTAKTTFEYDSSQPGLVSYVTPPRGNTGSTPDHDYATHFVYYGASDPASKRGMLASVTDPLGNVTSFDYDAVGRRISMVDPLGNASGGTPSQHTWEYQYDNEDRLRFAKAPAPSGSGGQLVTESRYDGVGNLTTLIDANSQVTRYEYDERDSLQEIWESPNAWTDPAATPSPKYVTAYQVACPEEPKGPPRQPDAGDARQRRQHLRAGHRLHLRRAESQQRHEVRRRDAGWPLARMVRRAPCHLTTCLLVARGGPEARFATRDVASLVCHWPTRTARRRPYRQDRR